MSSTSRLNIFHVGEVRGRGSERKGGSRAGERAIVVRIAVHVQVQAPLKPIGGGRSTPVWGCKLSPLIGLCAPWRHRAAGVTYNFKHAELWIQSVDWYSPYRVGLPLKFRGLPNLRTDRQTPFDFAVTSLCISTPPVLLQKGEWF